MESEGADLTATGVTAGQVSRQLVLMSACLAGKPCAYDGTSAGPSIDDEHAEGVVTVCPEVLGGLPTPRSRAEIVGGNGHDVLRGQARVMTCHGDDVTDEYISGARKALDVAQKNGAVVAVLQDLSPSCGSKRISDGSFARNRVAGVGVTAALFAENNIRVISADDVDLSDIANVGID